MWVFNGNNATNINNRTFMSKSIDEKNNNYRVLFYDGATTELASFKTKEECDNYWDDLRNKFVGNKRKEYCIVDGTQFDNDFQNTVNKKIMDGWNTIGGVSVVYAPGHFQESDFVFFQAMEK